MFVVLNEAQDADDPRPRIMTINEQVKRVGIYDLDEGARVVGQIRLPNNFDSRSAKSRDWLAKQLKGVSFRDQAKQPKLKSASVQTEIDRLRRAIRSHPCHGCSDREDHLRWQERNRSAQRDIRKLEDRISARTSSIASEFDRVCQVLEQLGYLHKDESGLKVTDRGRLLRGIYSDRDLLVSECIERGTWSNLNLEQLASAISILVFDARRDEDNPISIPEGEFGDVLIEMQEIWGDLKDIESQHRVDFLADLDYGFVWPALRWARGQDLSKVLRNQNLAAGDFVRWIKQVIDLLGQISVASLDEDLASTTRDCANLLNRGIVAW